jgi:ankyrin repeat protein
LHLAADKNHKDIAALLLAKKADPNARSNTGWTPLHCAADYGFKDIVELLLANKADVNAKTERTVVTTDPSMDFHEVTGDWTPFHMAAAKGHTDIAELLRQHGGHE